MKVKKISVKWLKKHNACCSESDMQEAEKIGDVRKIVNKLMTANRFKDANWLLTKTLTKKDCIRYKIYAAKQVLYIYEAKYPNDNIPRRAIKAAKKYLNNPTLKNKTVADAAIAAAYNVANAAIAAAADTADAAAYTVYATYTAAADAAAYAAYAYATDTAYATYTADAAAYAAYAAYAAADDADDTVKIKTKIIKYGIKLLYRRIK